MRPPGRIILAPKSLQVPGPCSSMPRCPPPCSTSGSTLPRRTPIPRPCGSARWPPTPRSACDFARSCSGPSSRRRAGPTSPFNLYPAKGRHMWSGLERPCADLGLPFRRPDPFPQNSLLAARVALAGLEQALGDNFPGEDFCRALFRAEFAEGRRIDDPATIADLLVRSSVEPRPALAAAQSEASKARLRTQTDEAQRLGVFGAPSFTTADGELFWGNDRLEAALRWARRPPRANSE